MGLSLPSFSGKWICASCLFVCLFVCLFMFAACCLFVCVHARVCVHVYVWKHLCFLVCMRACVCVHACIVCMRALRYACLYLCLYMLFYPKWKMASWFTIGPYLLRTLIVKFVVVVVVVVVVITFRLFLASQEEPKVIDTKELKVCRKRVRPLSSQTEMESRRLWQNVTAALKSKDIDSATAAKHLVSRSSKSLLVDSCRRALGDQTRTV